MVTNDLWHYFFASTAKHEYYLFPDANPLVKHTAPLSMGTGTPKYVG